MWPETMPPSVALLLTFVFVTAPARALEWPDRPRVDLSSQPPASTQKNHHVTQIHSLSDFKYKITAYRDAKEKTCYLQSIASSNNKQYLELYKNVLYGKRETRKIPKTFYTVPGSLSKSQVLHLAGARVASYCRGFTTMILLPGPPQSMTNDFPDSAESPPSEPSLPRYLKEQMEKRRQKRNAKGKRRYQGQTQVQTIALGDQLNTAESLAQKNTSQTKLSTTRGMSQAQSQSIYEEDCDGCGDRQSNRNGYSWGQIYDQSGQDAGVGFRPNEMHTPGRGIHLPNRRPSGQGYDHDKPSGTGLKPGELYRPDGHKFGPDGKPAQPWDISRPIDGGIRSGFIHGPGGQNYGTDGRPIIQQTPIGGGVRPAIGSNNRPVGQAGVTQQNHKSGLRTGGNNEPGRQIYGPGGRHIGQGEATGPTDDSKFRPRESYGQGSYGTDGIPVSPTIQEPFGPGPGGLYRPGQIDGSDRRPNGQRGEATDNLGSGLKEGDINGQDGQIYRKGGIIYQPDRGPISQGRGTYSPGLSPGPGGRIHGTDGRPSSPDIRQGQPQITDVGEIRPGESYRPGGPYFNPSGNLVGLGEQRGPTGTELGPTRPYDQHKVDSNYKPICYWHCAPGATTPPSRPIFAGSSNIQPGGQVYSPAGRPIQPVVNGVRPGETYRPGGQTYGPDGRPIPPGTGGLQPGGQIYGPGGQSYGPDGRPILTGLRPGEKYEPGGQIYGPGGQSYGPDGKPISTGPGETYGPGGQSYGPDGRPIQTGLRPGETYGPGGQIYGPDGRPISIGTGELQPGGTYSPGGQGYGPDGRPIPTVGLRPAGEVIGSSGPIYGPDGRPITPGSGGMFGPGGQAYGPVSLTSNNGNGAQQYSPEDLGENDGHSQVKTSISQQNNETIASSSSQGSYGGGKTQTSVSGSYKGSGSFSAQAQTIDTKRGAQSQVVGGDDGASSSAQAFGGKGQSQSQVSLSPETGLTSANSQTTGSGYSTQSEIHASETGGNSVAQATGVGKTSSQAQVKFKPYQNGRESDSQRIPFLGSGSASAQTGPRTGISQSEIFGSFKYGISYTGAAQASSGSKVDREKDGLAPFKDLVFNSTDVKLNTTYAAKPAEQSPVQTEETVSTTQKYDEDYVSSVEDDDDDEDIAPTGVPQTAQTLDRGDQPSTHLNTNEDLVTAQSQHGNPQLYPYVTQVDLPPDALESGYLRQRQEDKISHIRPQSAFSMNNFKQEQYQSSFNQQPYQRQVVTVGKPTNTIARAPNSQRKGNYGNPAQSQSVILGDISNMGVRVMQDADGIGLSSGDVYKSGQPVPGKSGYQIPPGFRGRVVGVNGDYAQASNNQGGQAQTQTVILTPGPGKYEYKGPDNRKSADADYDEYGPEDDSDEEQDTHPPNSNHQNYGRAFQAPPASFVSVTQKVSSQAPYSPPKEFEHTYFTKASKCGYTTYSCQLIDGSNGRAKVCKPKVTKNGNCE